MKKHVVVLAMALAIAALAAVKSFAADPMKVNNKFCPITGEEIGKEEGMKGQEAMVEYKGKVYNLCCSMCKKNFMKDPEAAIKKMMEKEPDNK